MGQSRLLLLHRALFSKQLVVRPPRKRADRSGWRSATGRQTHNRRANWRRIVWSDGIWMVALLISFANRSITSDFWTETSSE